MVVWIRNDTRFEARQFDGTRESVADMLQDRQPPPNGIEPGMWVVRQIGHAAIRTHRDHVFRRRFEREDSAESRGR